MNSKLSLIIILTLTTITMKAQTENELVQNAIHQFAQAADNRDVDQLKSILHNEFRVTLNRMLGSANFSVLTKESYLQMTIDGKLGGDKRTVEILSIDVTHDNAIAKVNLIGSKLTFISYYLLVKNNEGNWQLLNDLPYASKK